MSPPATVVSVLDWGIGGVGLLAALRQARPDLALRYRSDAGFAPWGRVPTAALRRRLGAIIDAEVAAGAEAVCVACNAASTVLVGLEGRAPLGVVGVIRPGVAAVLAEGWRHVGVVGGARTVRTGAWARPLRAAGVEVRQRVAQPLSAAVERGEADSDATRALVARICAPLTGVDGLVLACTHYPAAAAAFTAALPGVALFDPMPAALTALLARLPPAPGAAAARGPLSAWTSGDPVATRRAALAAFGVELGPVAAAEGLDEWTLGTATPGTPRHEPQEAPWASR